MLKGLRLRKVHYIVAQGRKRLVGLPETAGKVYISQDPCIIMKLYAVIAIMLVLGLPLVRAQGQPAAPAEQPVIPEDVAGMLVGVGSGPAISVVMDLADTCLSGVLDVLDTCVALLLDSVFMLGSVLVSCLYGNALWNCLESWVRLCVTCFGCCPWDFWCECLPCVSVIPHTLRAARSACNLIAL